VLSSMAVAVAQQQLCGTRQRAHGTCTRTLERTVKCLAYGALALISRLLLALQTLAVQVLLAQPRIAAYHGAAVAAAAAAAAAAAWLAVACCAAVTNRGRGSVPRGTADAAACLADNVQCYDQADSLGRTQSQLRVALTASWLSPLLPLLPPSP
jgi:hypothetical protein